MNLLKLNSYLFISTFSHNNWKKVIIYIFLQIKKNKNHKNELIIIIINKIIFYIQ